VSKVARVVGIVITFFVFTSPLLAQDNSEPEINLTIFCQDDVTTNFRVFINQDFDLGIEVPFPDKAPANSLSAFVIDGGPGCKNEARLAKLTCSKNSDTGTTCSGALTLEREAKLAQEFNFDQDFLNFSIRKGKNGKDVCLGKFTNNPDLLTANDSLERAYCVFQASDNDPSYSDFSGTGTFDPAEYGNDPDAETLFHMTLLGFPEGKLVRGCVVTGKGRYEQVFSSRTWGSTKTDADIYGSELSAAELAKLNDQRSGGIHYSYDRYRTVLNSAGQVSAFFGDRSLNQINRSVSSPSSSSGRSDSNSSRSSSSKNQKKKKRRRGKRRKKGNFSAFESLAVKAQGKSNKKERIFSFMFFDPLSDTVYLAPNCRGDVPAKAYGQVVCSKDSSQISDARTCLDFVNADANAATEGKTCLEPRTGFTLVGVRTKGLPDGEYTVCLNDQALSKSLVSLSTSSGASGNLEATDNESVAENLTDVILTGVTLSELSTVKVSTNSDCTSPLMTATFP